MKVPKNTPLVSIKDGESCGGTLLLSMAPQEVRQSMDMRIMRDDCIKTLQPSGTDAVDAEELVNTLLQKKKNLEAAGKLQRGAAGLAAAVIAEYEAARAIIALRRRQTALSITKRMENENYIAMVKDAGFTALDALEAMIVGSDKKVPGARKSIDAARSSIEAQWQGRFINGLEEISVQCGGGRHLLMGMLAGDTAFMRDCAREALCPGAVEDPKVKAFVDLYWRLAAEMRRELNKAGAYSDRLEGGLPQSHDSLKLLNSCQGGKQGWIMFVEEAIDQERNFPGKTQGEIRERLSDIFDAAVTGREKYEIEIEPISPRSIASGLNKRCGLHFRDADAFMGYMERYGRGNLFDSVFDEIGRNARALSLVQRLGPNPERMLRSLVDGEIASLKSAVGGGKRNAAAVTQQIRKLENAFTPGVIATGRVACWLQTVSSESRMPVTVGFAKHRGIAMSMRRFSRLGEAALSTVSGTFAKAMSMRVKGVSFFERTTPLLLDVLKMYKDRGRNVARELGLLMRDINGSVLRRFDQAEALPGRISAAMNVFFKYSGTDCLAESAMTGYAMWLSRYIASVRNLPFDTLPADILAMFERHGINGDAWELYSFLVESGGDKAYFTPALAHNLEDAQIAHLLPEHLRGDRPGKGFTPESWLNARQRELKNIRCELEINALSVLADEARFAIIGLDTKTAAAMPQGARAGSKAGGTAWAGMLFPRLPIAFIQRVVLGQRWQHGGMEEGDCPGALAYTVSALIYGYLGMTLNSLAKNRAPQDPLRLETWLAAAVQSGGACVYGDFILSKASRFGNDCVAYDDPEQAREQAVRIAMGGSPLVNLWFTLAAMEYFLLDRMYERMSPGYKAQRRRNMQKEFEQIPLLF